MTAETSQAASSSRSSRRRSGAGHGARSRDRLRHRRAERRLRVGLQRGRARHGIQDLPAADRQLPQTTQPIALPERRRGTELVLIVEDDNTVRELSRRVLESVGYRVIEAANPEAAEGIFTSDVELLVTDVIMPGSERPRPLPHARPAQAGVESPVHVRLYRRHDRPTRPPRTGHGVSAEAVYSGCVVSESTQSPRRVSRGRALTRRRLIRS